MSTQHLSDEQFTDLLAGEAAANTGAAAHLETCASCRHELDSTRSAVGTLRNLSLCWAEERAVRIGAPSRWRLGWHAAPAWSTAALLLFCGLALGVHWQGVPRPASQGIVQAQTVTAAPSDDELTADNRLLRSIDEELSRQVSPQVPASELTVASKGSRHSVPREVSN